MEIKNLISKSITMDIKFENETVVHPLSLLYDSCTGLYYLPYLCDKPFIRSSQTAYRNRQHSDSRSKMTTNLWSM